MQDARGGDCGRTSDSGGRPQIIMNADDFGRTSEINAAVIEAHRTGVLTSASLMVAGEAADEAVELARQTPTLAVGLHLVLIDGRAVLPHERIPHLTDEHGRFANNPVWVGLNYAFNRCAKSELAAEIEAQFRKFADTGLPLSHVDGHLHMHLHPIVFRLLLPLAEKFGARGVRIPCDRLKPALRFDRRRPATKLIWRCVFGLLARWCRRRLPEQGPFATACTYGLFQSGQMREAYVVDVLRRLSDATAEFYFHPTTGPRIHEFGANRGDLDVLLSAAVRKVIDEQSLQLTNWRGLRRVA
jgi:chitin disaccharide deacetylase